MEVSPTTADPGGSSTANVSPTEGAPATEQLSLVERVAAQLHPDAAPATEEEGAPTPSSPETPGSEPPPGSSDRQAENWANARQKIADLEATVSRYQPLAERLAAIEPFNEEINQFLQLSELVEVDPDVHGRQFERLIHTMNPALWDAMVRRAGSVYAQDLGLTGQPPAAAPPAQRAPVREQPPAPAQQSAPQAQFQVPEFTAEELEDRRLVYGDEEVARLQALVEAARIAQSSQSQIQELKTQIDDIRTQAVAAAIADANDRHDAQFSEEISNQIGAFVPRFIDVDGRKEWNPEFVALWKYFDKAFDSDPNAANARDLSREAYRRQMKGAQPRLTAAVRSHIGNVISRDIAPLMAARQAAQLAQTEEAKRAAATPPSPDVGQGAAPPATGQAGMSLVDRVALVKAGKSTT